jgi:hypothetical protein
MAARPFFGGCWNELTLLSGRTRTATLTVPSPPDMVVGSLKVGESVSAVSRVRGKGSEALGKKHNLQKLEKNVIGIDAVH